MYVQHQKESISTTCIDRSRSSLQAAKLHVPTVLLLISKSTWQMDGQLNIQIAFANQFNVTCKQQVNGGTSQGCPVSQIISSQIRQAGNEMFGLLLGI